MTTQEVQREAMQTIVPGKATHPVVRLPVTFCGLPHRKTFLEHSRFVFYYKQAAENDKDGWVIGGWIKQTLTMALPEFPAIAGRFDVENGPAIKCSDAGVRLVYAQAMGEKSMEEWIENAKKDESLEDQLTYWRDVDPSIPSNVPVCYIQVTNLQGDGFSIGITCSLYVASPIKLTTFIKSWTKLHLNHAIMLDTHLQQLPLFYRPNIRKGRDSTKLIPSQDHKDQHSHHQTNFLYRLPSAGIRMLTDQVKSTKLDLLVVLASLCIKKALLGHDSNLKVTIMVLDGSTSPTIDGSYTIGQLANLAKLVGDDGDGLVVMKWEELGLSDVMLQENNKPIYTSCKMLPCFG